VTTMPRSVVNMVLAAVMTAVLPCSASAECIRLWKDIPDAKRRAALVFSGTFVKYSAGTWVFDVDRVWKGPRQRRLELPLFQQSSEDFRFQQGETYVVFVDRKANPLLFPQPPTKDLEFNVSGCSPTKPVSQAQDTLAQLGKGSKPK
jgi:hypothetical protein